MPSSPSPLLKLELQQTGEKIGVWGDDLNSLFKATEQAIASIITLAITGDRTLTSDNYVANEYRRHALVLTGSPAADFTITVPAVSFPYRISNRTGKQATIKTALGAAAIVRPGLTTTVLCDGTDCTALDPTLDKIKTAAGPVSLGGNRLTGGADGTDPTDFVTMQQAPAVVAPQVQLAKDWAQKTGATVDGTEYSAKAWAISTTALTGGNKGAKGYALDAASSASGAASSASAASGSATNAATSATNAATSETNAGNSATLAAQQAARLSGSSTTSQTIGTGSKTFTTQAGKFFDPGTRLLISSDANPSLNSMFGTVTAYSGTSLTVNVTVPSGAGTFTDWTLRIAGERGAIGPSGSNLIQRSARTSNTAITASDIGTLIDITSGSFAQTFVASATIGAGGWVNYRNSGTGVVVLTPNGAETINGRPNLYVYPGESFTIQCDGTGLRTIGRTRRVLISDVTLATAAAAIDVEGFANDTEMLSLDFDVTVVTNSALMLFKKNGAYIASGGGSYSTLLLRGSNGSTSGLLNNTAVQMFVGYVITGSAKGIQSTAANGAKLIVTQGDGSGQTSVTTQTETTAAILQGLRVLGNGGNLDIGSNFRVWGNR